MLVYCSNHHYDKYFVMHTVLWRMMVPDVQNEVKQLTEASSHPTLKDICISNCSGIYMCTPRRQG